MLRWLLRRIVLVVVSTFVAVTVVFWLNVLVPGDAATAALSESSASQQILERRRAELGLDRPSTEQYLSYLSSLSRLDLGRSWATGQNVASLIASQIGPTASLAFASIVLAASLGLVSGLLSFVGPWALRLTDTASALSLSIPMMFTGSVAIWIIAIQLNWLPATGQGRGAQLILPTLILGANGAGSIYRVVRSALAETLPAAWVIAARARGFSKMRVWIKHILRPSLLPILNVIGLQFGYLLGGVAIVETLFARSGLGRLLVTGVLNKDVPVVLAIVITTALSYGCLNFAVDGLYLGLDPRLRTMVNG